MTDDKLRRPLFHETFGEGRQKTSVEVDLVIRANGDLVLDGCDFGAAPREIFGDSDYEYWLTIRSEDKNRVLQELLAEAGGEMGAAGADKDALVLDLVAARFKSGTAVSELQEWLKARGIPYAFDSY